jgi:2-polyprenyl-6-methoxyphenol hydroxylase-like FAD-dependent oxidoreductase
MIVIGDAAHVPSSSSGQGASLAIEDAVELARCLRDVPDPREAFVALERVRRPRVERIIRLAARVNNRRAATGLSRVIRDLILPRFLKAAAKSNSLKETYEYHIDWEAPVESAAS